MVHAQGERHAETEFEHDEIGKIIAELRIGDYIKVHFEDERPREADQKMPTRQEQDGFEERGDTAIEICRSLRSRAATGTKDRPNRTDRCGRCA